MVTLGSGLFDCAVDGVVPSLFFVIAATAVVGFVTLFFLEEPSGKIVEVMPDGTLAEIQVG